MPIRRTPVVHKFGIISHSKRLELQQRLAERVLDESVNFNPPRTPRKSQYSIDEDFVRQFNQTETGSEERLELENRAEQMFLRSKRKVGLRHGGVGTHVTVTDGWLELSLLAQCNSRSFQDGALSALYNSLLYAPISKSQIKSLFYIGFASMHWLTESYAGQPYLRTGELGIIKVAHLIFIRLYYHHLAGDISDLYDERRQLIDIIDAFDQRQDIYRPFPSALLFLRTIVQISECLKAGLEEEERKLANGIASINRMNTLSHQHGSVDSFTKSEVKGLFTKVLGEEILSEQDAHSYKSLFHDVTKQKSDERLEPELPSVHDISPTLWHSLDLWCILTHTTEVPDLALKELFNCSLDFVTEPRVDSILALHVLSEAAKISYETLLVLQQIGRRDIIGNDEDSPKHKTTTYRSTKQQSLDASTQRLVESMIFGGNEFSEQLKYESTNFASSECSKENHLVEGSHSKKDDISYNSTDDFVDRLKEFLHPKPMGPAKETSNNETGDDKNIGIDEEECMVDDIDSSNRNEDGFVSQNTGVRVQSSISGDEQSCANDDASFSDGSLADLSSLASMESHNEAKISRRRLKKKNTGNGSMHSSDESEVDAEKPIMMKSRNRDLTRESSMSLEIQNQNIEQSFASPSPTVTRPNTESSATTTKWPWELVVSYVRCLGDICLHSNESRIQRDAMIGCQGKNAAGLLQLLKFQLKVQTGSNMDWSWRVRHVTVQQLMKVCQMKQGECMKDGLQNAAWTALLSHHSTECDRRVLEAYKIARTEADLDRYEGAIKANTSLFSRISTNLAIIHVASIMDEYNADEAELKSSNRKKDQHVPYENIPTYQCDPRGEMSEKEDKPMRGERLEGNTRLDKSESSRRGERSGVRKRSKARNCDHSRVSIRNEIMIAKALDQNPDSFGKRSWRDVQNVVEDQWRKEVIEEYEITEKKRQEIMDKEIETLRKSFVNQSLKERTKHKL